MNTSERIKALEAEIDDLKFVVNRLTRMVIELEESMPEFHHHIGPVMSIRYQAEKAEQRNRD
mgnify:CR=1 FL=1